MGNDHEFEFQEMESDIFEEIKRMIRRLKVVFDQGIKLFCQFSGDQKFFISDKIS
jgi:hypothetical protein